MGRYLKADELREDIIEDVMALGGEALDLEADLERLERIEVGKVARAHSAIYNANRAEDHRMALGIVETAFDEIELLSEETLSELNLLRHALKDQRVYAALIAKHGDPDLQAKKAEVDDRIAKRHAARRLAARGIRLEVVKS